MKWTNRQYVDLMTYNHPERPMFSELFGPLHSLIPEWEAQGATPEMIGMTAFAFDWVPTCWLGNTGPVNCYPSVVLEDTPSVYRGIDGYGRRVRLDKRTATIPLPETFPVETMDDWLKIKHMFEWDDCRVISDDTFEHVKRLQDEGAVVVTGMCGGFDVLRDLMGEVNACIAFYEDPELINDILGTIAETTKRVFEQIASHITVDQLSIHEDMAGKSGSMIGPNLIEEFLKPYYHAGWDILHDSGTKLFCQDSDGNMDSVIDAFIDCGVNIFYPCEPAAGMDIVRTRKQYGHRISMRGGIDKFALLGTKADIDRELEYKLQPCVLEGGIVLGLDHRIVNGTPLENYIYYIDRAREMLGLPDFRKSEPGWGRMAF